MPSLKTLTGRPSPTAWADPAEAPVQPKSCNVRRSQWPFKVQGEEAKTTAAAAGSIAADMLVTDGLTATTISVGQISSGPAGGIVGAITQGAISAAQIAAGTLARPGGLPPADHNAVGYTGHLTGTLVLS